MKIIYLGIILSSITITVKSQDCFNEFDSTVASVTCINSEAEFEMMRQFAVISNPSQSTFTMIEDNIKNIIPSWDMIGKKGKFFNIHQYCFTKRGLNIYISYKIIKFKKIAELAIVIGKEPFYHSIVAIYPHPSNKYHLISDIGKFWGSELKFDLIFENDSNLLAFNLDDTMFLKINN